MQHNTTPTALQKLLNMKSAAVEGGGHSASLTPAQILAQQAKQNSTLVEIEERRLAKMRRRQEKELEQMLQFEVKMANIQEEMKRKTEKEQAMEEKRKRDKEKRLRTMAETRRLRELRRKAAEDADEEMQHQLAEEMFQRDMKILEEKKRQDRKNRVQARINDEERARKQEEHRLQTQRLFKEQQDSLKSRAEERARLEKIRMDKVKAKRDEDQRQYAQRREQVQERILTNLEMAKRREEKRKADFFDKKNYHEQLRAQALAQQEKDRALKNREAFLMEQKRQLTLKATRQKEEEDKEMLRQKFDDDDKFVAQLEKKRGKEHALLKERENLNKQLKLENVERIKRIQEYKRLETLRKINEGDKRTEEMIRRKEEIIAQRRKAGLQTKMQKDEMMNILESSRANGGRAIKMLQDALGGEATTGTTKKKKKKKKGADNSFEMAGTGATEYNTTAESLGPAPDATFKHLDRMNVTEGDAPMPYQSPYEIGAGGSGGDEDYGGPASKSETVTF